MDDSYETSDPDSSIEVVVNQLFKRAPLKLDDEDNESTLYHRGGQRQSGTPMISEGSGEGSREGTSGDDTDVTDFTEVELGMSEDGGYRAGAVFKKARQLLNPSLFYRTIVYLFAERKMVVFFGIHLVSTLIIWGKFCLLVGYSFPYIHENEALSYLSSLKISNKLHCSSFRADQI